MTNEFCIAASSLAEYDVPPNARAAKGPEKPINYTAITKPETINKLVAKIRTSITVL